ncbi:hypothetical protein QQF64_026280 [Cirrhinus molitorella]|uniref:Ribosomal RNA-processing protein 7 C-terminal domain-containing protein n=1 Tax=Cirrhinus molitorella TaxID=172907 RepID=A0ABR3NRV7_9TELE
MYRVFLDGLRRFSAWPIQSVGLNEKKGAVPHIIFKKPIPWKNSQKVTPERPLCSTAPSPSKRIRKWIQQYSDSRSMQPTAAGRRSFMNDYDRCKEEGAERRRGRKQQQEDEEGWVKVTKGKRGVKARPHSEAANEGDASEGEERRSARSCRTSTRGSTETHRKSISLSSGRSLKRTNRESLY